MQAGARRGGMTTHLKWKAWRAAKSDVKGGKRQVVSESDHGSGGPPGSAT